MNDSKQTAAETTSPTPPTGRTGDEVALELMKFVAITTGYGRGTGGAGFTGKQSRTPEEHADALIELFERCRSVVNGKS